MAPPPPQRAGASQLLRAGPPASAASVLSAFGFCLGTLPLATRGPNLDPFRLAVGIDARLPMFRARAADQAHAASAPGTTWPTVGQPPSSSRERDKDPRFRCHRSFHSASTATPRPDPDALERLLDPHLTRSSHAFSLTLTTTVFSQRSTGWFDARPRRPTPEGQQSSISCTAPLLKLSPT